MVRVTRPLFSDSAHGRIDGIGSYRRGRNGPEFISQAQPTDRRTSRQTALRARFADAKAAHGTIIPTPYTQDGRTHYHRIPDWKTFWANWINEHPL